MRKHILFAATERDCNCRFRSKGNWCATSYVLYSDGTCCRMTERDYMPTKIVTLRMDERRFQRICDLLENQFDNIPGMPGCDGLQWKMHHYSPEGRCLHSFHGFIHGSGVLTEISELLAKC